MIKNAGVEINGGCNYACPMCPQSSGREKNFLKKMPLSVFEKICAELEEAGCKTMNLQGSGEPLLNRNIDEYVKIGNKYNISSSIVTNGYNLSEDMSLKLLDSGIDTIRVSVIGYDKNTYKQWMSKDAFNFVYQNCRKFLKVLDKGNYETNLTSYHLILDNNKVKEEIENYKLNWISPLDIKAEIWMMHNWGGQFNTPYERETTNKRSCGRPFAPYINIRAGGDEKRYGAVVPCCYVLGQDSKAILGHLDTESLIEVWRGSEYKKLRKAHEDERFDDIDYCKDCDQLYEAPDSLVWTNIEGKKYGQHKSDQDLDFRQLVQGT